MERGEEKAQINYAQLRGKIPEIDNWIHEEEIHEQKLVADVVTYEDGSVDVLTAADAFEAVRAAMTAAGLAPGDAEVTFHPSTAGPVVRARRPRSC